MIKILTTVVACLISHQIISAELRPFGDNILFAFDKCQLMEGSSTKVQLILKEVSGFDIHCKLDSGSTDQFKCDFFDTKSGKKVAHEALQGGRVNDQGVLQNAGGTRINLSIKKGMSFFSSPEQNQWSVKACSGIFLFEKEAKHKKK